MTGTPIATQVEWLSPQEAGERLDKSPRRVLELAQQGKLQSSRVKHPQTGQQIVRIQAGSIERYLDESKVIPEPTACDSHANGIAKHNTKLMERAKGDRAIGNKTLEPISIGEILGVISRATRTRYALWLTLDQAADYSGLPAAILRAWVESGKLAALDVGRRRGGRYRLSRRDLDGIRSASGLLLAPDNPSGSRCEQ